MSDPFLSIVIPAYNEANRIMPLLSELSDPGVEYILVCDGDDETPEIIQKYSTKHPELTLRILVFPDRLGKGGGVHAGFLQASAPLVGFMDADNSTPVFEIIRLCTIIGEYDGVIGSRHLPGQVLMRKQSVARRMQSRVFNGIIRLLFGLSFYDTQCGAKVFRKKALDTVLPSLRAKGFEFDVELLWRLKTTGFFVTEVPVIWNDTEDSRLRLSDTFSMFLTLFRIRFGSS